MRQLIFAIGSDAQDNIIETVDGYDLLSFILLDSQVNADDCACSLPITKGYRDDTGDITGQSIEIIHEHCISTALLSGVVVDHLHIYMDHCLPCLVLFH